MSANTTLVRTISCGTPLAATNDSVEVQAPLNSNPRVPCLHVSCQETHVVYLDVLAAAPQAATHLPISAASTAQPDIFAPRLCRVPPLRIRKKQSQRIFFMARFCSS